MNEYWNVVTDPGFALAQSGFVTEKAAEYDAFERNERAKALDVSVRYVVVSNTAFEQKRKRP